MGLSLSMTDDPSAGSLCHTHSSPSRSSVEGCEHWLRCAFLSPLPPSSSLSSPPHHHRCSSISGLLSSPPLITGVVLFLGSIFPVLGPGHPASHLFRPQAPAHTLCLLY